MNMSLNSEVNGTCLLGTVVIFLFVIGGALWAMFAPLSGAVIAKGVVGFEGEVKTIQHLEGGIIAKIHVAEGDKVSPGALLVTLDRTTAHARAEEIKSQIRGLAGEESRLLAERGKQTVIQFDHPLLQQIDDPDVIAIRAQQQSHIYARTRNLDTQRKILNKRIAQLRKQKVGLQRQIEGTRTESVLIREEVRVIQQMVKRGFERKPRLVAAMRTQAQLKSTEGSLMSSIARIEEAVGETELRILNLETALLEEIDGKLTTVNAERTRAEKRYQETQDALARTQIRSPVEGVILATRFKTIGGVIRPGESILEIAPTQDKLIVSARVSPNDIEQVSPGSQTAVLFTAFQQRNLQRITGEVTHVSADAIADSMTGERYFQVNIGIDPLHLMETAPEIELSAGMPADVFIATSDGTLAKYLFSPVVETFTYALRES